MPYFYDPNLDKDKNNEQGLQLSSASTTMDPAGKPADPSQAGAPTGASRFQNLDAYLNNNDAKGAGQEFGNKVKSEVDQAKSTMDTAAGQFTNKVNSSGVTADQSQIDAAVADPMKADVNQFASWRDAEYKGPNSLGDDQSTWNQYWGAAKNANTTAKQAGSESGRFALLDKYFGRPAYNFGEKSLDNLLIQRGGGLGDISDIQKKASGLNTYGTEQAKQLAGTAAQRAGQVEQTRKAARSAVGLGENGQVSGGALGSMESDITKRVKDYNDKAGLDYSTVLDDLSDDTVSGDTLAALGLENGQSLYGLNLADYFRKNPQDATAATTATDEDYARYLALSKLAGIDPTFLTEADMGKADSNGPTSGFDKDRLLKDVASEEAAFMNAVHPYQAEADQAYAALVPPSGKSLQQQRDDAYYAWQTAPNTANFVKYRDLANQYNFEINKYEAAKKKVDEIRSAMKADRKLGLQKASIAKPKSGPR